jgi:thioredoxin-dependent peroxiredoxin
MPRLPATLLASCLLVAQAEVHAALPDGTQAPLFTTQASLAGSSFQFSLADALKKGPVVLYFYPAAFTAGCTEEAHRFAAAVEKFSALGATVIGVSRDPIDKLNRFSVSECRSKFAVAADAGGRIMKAYDARLLGGLLGVANRTSYVIAPTGEILYSYTALAPGQHVENTLAAVRKWRAAHGGTDTGSPGQDPP